MTWLCVSRDHYRSACGRYEFWRAWVGRWVAIDAERGRIRRFESEAAAKQWCCLLYTSDAADE